MESAQTTSTARRLGTCFALLFFLIVLIGLLSANYFAGLALTLGVLVAFPAPKVVLLLRGRTRLVVLSVLPLLALFCLLTALSLPGLLGGPLIGQGCLDPKPHFSISNKDYRATLDQSPKSADKFTVREQVVISEDRIECVNQSPKVISTDTVTLKLPEREIASTNRGFLLKEVNFTPLQSDPSGIVTAQLPDGTSQAIPLCCPSSGVEVRDLPKGSFYQAKGAGNLKSESYVDTETVNWSVQDLSRGIAFAYVPSPFSSLRPILQPFVGAASIGEWIIAIIGIVGTLILTPIVSPVVYDVAKNAFKSGLQRSSPQPVETATLIVSDKGEEKKISIAKK